MNAGNLRVTVVAAAGLFKSGNFSLPDPFATISINGEQTCRTGVIEKTTTPCWNESFVFKAKKDNILTVRVFDQKKLKKEQGFLGVVKVQIGSVIDLSVDGYKSITQDLQIPKSSGGLVGCGKLTVNLSAIPPPVDFPSQHSDAVPLLLPDKPVKAVPAIYSAATSAEPQVQQQMSIGHAFITSSHTGNTSIASSINERRPSSQSTTSEDAILAWNRRFTTLQVHFELNEQTPFTPVRQLGGGGIGIVFETKLDGVALALKRTYSRGLTPDLNEFKILSRIMQRRHKHIVELVGSYTHKQQRGFELGLLIWPVARCDLAVFLQDIDSLRQWINQESSGGYNRRNEDLDSAVIESLSAITGFSRSWSSTGALNENAAHLYESSLRILCSRYGCISNAVAWLHQHGIRHKDLKPSQILLSPQGMWLTDFGWSKDISEQAQSTTSDGDNITLKYQSPERAQRHACGRPEDIFALGCIFIEMAYQLAKPRDRSEGCLAPWQERGWFFQANLDQVQALLKSLERPLQESGHGFLLTKLIEHMLALKPDDRPSINEVAERLSPGSYFGECCAPAFEARPSSFGNYQQSQSDITNQSQSNVTNHYAQRYLATPYFSDTVPTVSHQPLYLSTTTPNLSVNTSKSYQAGGQAAYAQQYIQNYNTGVSPSTNNISNGYSEGTGETQPHVQATINQNSGHVYGASSDFNTPRLPNPTNASGNHFNQGADYVASYHFHDPNIFAAQSFQDPGLNRSFSNLTVTNFSPHSLTPSISPDTTHGAGPSSNQRVNSFGYTTTSPDNGIRNLLKQGTHVINHHVKSFIKDNRTGRDQRTLH